jgi:tRNA nucleotidyltransferase/poly(A) polymerase
MDSLTTTWTPSQPAFQALLNALAAEVDPVYVVGGVVRDALLGRSKGLTDLDVIVVDQANRVARRIADRLGWAYYALDAERDVARLVFTASKTPLVCDVAAMRGGELTTDLQLRDFTVNAMAMRWRRNTAAELVDLANGCEDLALRQLRRVTPWSMADDPVRLLRAVRLAVQLDFTVENDTLLQILRLGDTLRLVSPERVRDELWKMLALAQPERALEMLREYRFLHILLPEVAEMEGVAQSAPHDADVYDHTLRAVRYAAAIRDWLACEKPIDDTEAGAVMAAALAPHLPKLRHLLLNTTAAERRQADWLVWFALWHDVGKPSTRTTECFADGAVRYRFLGHEEAGALLAEQRMEALKFSRYEASLMRAVIQAHMRPHLLHVSFGADPFSRRACYRFFRDSAHANQTRAVEGEVGIDTVLLGLADYQAIYAVSPPPDWAEYVRHAGELIAFGVAPSGLAEVRRPLVDGHTLMAYFKLAPGPQIGALLEQLREAQAAGEIATPEEGLALATELLTGTV